jgi:hypothetical protein
LSFVFNVNVLTRRPPFMPDVGQQKTEKRKTKYP